MVKAKEYRYVSPVFGYEPTTAGVLSLVSVALTNSPALTHLWSLAINSTGALPPLEARSRAEWHCNSALQKEFSGSFDTYPALCRDEPRHAPGRRILAFHLSA